LPDVRYSFVIVVVTIEDRSSCPNTGAKVGICFLK